MAGTRTEGAFPDARLPDVDGALHALRDAWREDDALFMIGHRNCKTTRQTLPYLDRIHRRCRPTARVAAILQDDAETARELIASLGLALPIRLEPDPYEVAQALDLAGVPTLFLVSREGRIERVSEAFNRADIEQFASRLGVAGPLFLPEDKAPAMKPG